MTDPALRALALHVNSCHECACLHDAAAHTGAAAEAAPLDPREGHGVSGLFHHEPGAPCVVCDRHAAAEAAPLDANGDRPLGYYEADPLDVERLLRTPYRWFDERTDRWVIAVDDLTEALAALRSPDTENDR